jgi:hypothetical protein
MSLQHGSISARNYLIVLVQLGLLALVLQQFQIESAAFLRLAWLAFAGFALHALLPLRFRLPFLLLLSLAGIGLVLGVINGLWLVAIGVGLIGLCHVPVSFRMRVALLLAAGALLVALRASWLPSLWSEAIWPILGSMFMFRLVIYVYDLRHDKAPVSVTRTLSYFFMLPNVCFPLFPVVDYKAFRRNYYDDDAYRIYQVGINWIVRGVIHLVLYRFVYLYLTLAPSEVTDAGDLVRYLVSNFLLYLRISGQFHLVIGMLYLFGFRLPETHHLYLLASSFADFWRRINIYWKDFMMKLVFYPSFFRLRRWGDTAALVGATIIVFLTTWLLHSYQWFWLRGGFPLEPQDALFWGTLGALVVFGSLREMKQPKKRAVGRGPAWSASLALRTLGTFSAICILWSLWTADSVMAWLMLWIAAGSITPDKLWLLAGLVVGGLLIAGRTWSMEPDQKAALPFYRQPAVYPTAVVVAMLFISNTELYTRFTPTLASTMASLQRSTLNARDATLQHKGYYEKLDHASRMSAQLWSVQAQKPAHWIGMSSTEAHRVRDDFLLGELRPNAKIIFMDQPLTTNQWGMRDRDHPLAKPAGTYRIALLGPSHVMGSGVADGETFADFLEEQLNRQTDQEPSVRYEVLNFGVPGNSLLDQLFMLEDRAVKFQPDAIFITDSSRGKTVVVSHLLKVVSSRYAIPFPGLDALVRGTGATALADHGFPVPFQSVRALLGSVGVQTRMPWLEAERRVRLADDQIMSWALVHMAALTRQYGAVPVFVALDNVEDPPAAEVRSLRHAEAAGFLVFNLFDLWQGLDKRALRIAEWDNHPNANGNRLIADRLVELMEQHRAKLLLDRPVLKTAVNPTPPAANR